MTRPTFTPATTNGPGKPIAYKPLIYTRMTGIYRLALHRASPRGPWRVSDPVSGFCIARITATYKGVPVSSECLNQKQAQACALAELDLLVDRIGFDRFDRTITTAQSTKD